MINLLGSEDKPQFKKIQFQGKWILLSLEADGQTYSDAYGTQYPDIDTDPGYCGIEPLETGMGDPWWKTACLPHDHAFSEVMNGYQDTNKDNIKTFLTFSKAIGTGMLTGLFMTVSGLPYFLIGGVGGFLRETYLSYRNK